MCLFDKLTKPFWKNYKCSELRLRWLVWWGSEFSSYEIELRNRVTKNDVTLRVTNSKSKNKNLHFEILTRRFNFYFSTFESLTRRWKIKRFTSTQRFSFFYFRVTNSRLTNKKLHFVLLTWSQKMKKKTLQVTNSIAALFCFTFELLTY